MLYSIHAAQKLNPLAAGDRYGEGHFETVPVVLSHHIAACQPATDTVSRCFFDVTNTGYQSNKRRAEPLEWLCSFALPGLTARGTLQAYAGWRTWGYNTLPTLYPQARITTKNLVHSSVCPAKPVLERKRHKPAGETLTARDATGNRPEDSHPVVTVTNTGAQAPGARDSSVGIRKADIVTGGPESLEQWQANVLEQFQHRGITPAMPSGGEVKMHHFAVRDIMHNYSDQYLQYLKSPEWNERRQARLQKAQYRCEKCGEREGLEVHHKTYDNLGNEPLSDLIALCRSCHWAADEDRRGNKFPRNKLSEPIKDQPVKQGKGPSAKQRRAIFLRDKALKKRMRTIE